MMPPPLAPGAIFPAPPAAMLPRGPPAPFAQAYPPIFYWPYPSPPVSPTSYYNPATVPGIASIPQQAALLTPPECLQLGPPEPRVDALIPRPDVDKRMSHPSLQAPCNQYVDLFFVVDHSRLSPSRNRADALTRTNPSVDCDPLYAPTLTLPIPPTCH